MIAADLVRRYDLSVESYDEGKVVEGQAGQGLRVEKGGWGEIKQLLDGYTKAKDAKERPIVVFVDGHVMWGNDWRMVHKDRLLSQLKEQFVSPLAKYKELLHPASQFVVATPSAVHEWAWKHESMPRAIAYRDLMLEALEGSGWRVLDALNPTITRPEYRSQRTALWANQTSGVTFSLTNILLNMICGESS
jgi:hypothetical protein